MGRSLRPPARFNQCHRETGLLTRGRVGEYRRRGRSRRCLARRRWHTLALLQARPPRPSIKTAAGANAPLRTPLGGKRRGVERKGRTSQRGCTSGDGGCGHQVHTARGGIQAPLHLMRGGVVVEQINARYQEAPPIQAERARVHDAHHVHELLAAAPLLRSSPSHSPSSRHWHQQRRRVQGRRIGEPVGTRSSGEQLSKSCWRRPCMSRILSTMGAYCTSAASCASSRHTGVSTRSGSAARYAAHALSAPARARTAV
jgi:hypothetical protein